VTTNATLKPFTVQPEQGRHYSMGKMSAVFKADSAETNSTLSVSEWWLEPDTDGPHAHQHPEAHMIYVIDGTLSVYLQDKGWFEAVKGSYIYIPGGVEHTFENQSSEPAGFISINTPGGFEASMPNIVSYLDEHPLGSAVKRK